MLTAPRFHSVCHPRLQMKLQADPTEKHRVHQHKLCAPRQLSFINATHTYNIGLRLLQFSGTGRSTSKKRSITRVLSREQGVHSRPLVRYKQHPRHLLGFHSQRHYSRFLEMSGHDSILLHRSSFLPRNIFDFMCYTISSDSQKSLNT